MVRIKLKRQIFDLLQHCEINCNGWCCSWGAFDFSAHWVRRWCEFREKKELYNANSELQQIDLELLGEPEDIQAEVIDFLRTDVGNLRERLTLAQETIVTFAAEALEGQPNL